MIEHHGWQAPAYFTSGDGEVAHIRASGGLADLSWTLKFDLKGRGLQQPVGAGPEASWWVVGRLHGLITCEPTAGDLVRERLEQIQIALAEPSLPPPLYVTDVSSVYAHLLLAGPRSREVLNKLTSLNLSDTSMENLACAQASLAHVHATILRKDSTGIPAYQLLVSREYGESVWESVLHAGHEFNIVPFGLEAQRTLQG
jgi:heterotetrameric sarcosine oxidase gamma subunit